MGSFKGDLHITESKKTKGYFTVTKGFSFYLGKSRKFIIRIPKGTETNFASVPRWLFGFIPLWSIIPPYAPQYGKTVVTHDKLYESGELPKIIADAVMLFGMLLQGTKKWKAVLMYLAVVFHGQKAWDKCRAKNN